MSPVPSTSTTSTASSATPSVSPESFPFGQSASAVSPYLGPGGLVFCAVAIISVASYFYHKRGTADDARTKTSRTPFSSFLSSRRHRSSDVTPLAATTDGPAGPECHPEQHVSMVYARFFHPTFWKLVECHPPTPLAPAIYIEDEATETPVSEPKPYGMTSFLDVGEEDEDETEAQHCASEKSDRGTRHQVKRRPPYDASEPIDVNFRSELIGVTMRPGAFLEVPGEFEDSEEDASEDLSDLDPSESFSADDGSLATPPGSCPGIRAPDMAVSAPEVRVDASLSAYDEGPPTGLESPCRDRRYGLADMTHLAQRLQHAIPDETDHPGRHATTRAVAVAPSADADPATSDASSDLHLRASVDDAPCCDGAGDDHDRDEAVTAPRDGPGADLMRTLLDALRDPDLDCNPRRALSQATSSDDDDDDDDDTDTEAESEAGSEVEADTRHASLSVPVPVTTCDASAPTAPVTPPVDFPAPPPPPTTTTATLSKTYVRHARKWSRAPSWFGDKVQPETEAETGSLDVPVKARVSVRARKSRDGRAWRVFAPWAL